MHGRQPLRPPRRRADPPAMWRTGRGTGPVRLTCYRPCWRTVRDGCQRGDPWLHETGAAGHAACSASRYRNRRGKADKARQPSLRLGRDCAAPCPAPRRGRSTKNPSSLVNGMRSSSKRRTLQGRCRCCHAQQTSKSSLHPPRVRLATAESPPSAAFKAFAARSVPAWQSDIGRIIRPQVKPLPSLPRDAALHGIGLPSDRTS